MRTVFYYWLMRLAYKATKYHFEKFCKWRDNFKKLAEKWNEGYITGGSGNADTN